MRKRWGAALCAALALAGCQRSVDAERLAAPQPSEWLSHGRTQDEQRFSPLTQINVESVKDLGLAWWAEFDTDRGQEATPLVVDGVLYTTTAWSKVFAFDAATGEKKWSFDPKIDQAKGFDACCDVVNRGVAVWGDKVFVGTIDGRLIALDAKEGKVAWSAQTTDNAKPYTITGAPRVVKGKVLIGNGGAEYGVRGYISAYDAATGKLAWRFFTTPNPEGKPDGAASDKVMAEKAAATWSDGAWKQTGGGGTAWDAMAYDPKLDLLYVGVGNGSPWNHKLRSGGKGDNLFLSSILALKPDTGEYVWHYQTTPGESWDYTATQHIMLADLSINGAPRRVVMQAPKNGFFYVLDAATGALISAEKFVPVEWADRIDPATGRPVERPAARYPAGTASDQLVGPLGGHNWHPMAFHPKTGLVYIPAQYGRGLYADPDSFTFTPGATNQGMRRGTASPANPNGDLRPGGRGPAKGELIAWDPVRQAKRWSVTFPHMVTSGVLATAGDLVFHSAEGRFTAYEAASGKPVWSHPTTARAIAPAMTYELDGVQHVALMVGVGGAGVGDQPRRRGRLLVFKLGGKAQAAPYPDPVIPGPLNLALAQPSRGDADAGAATYAAYCANCHGAGPFHPDLTRSPAILDPDGFRAIVLDGALKDRGMAGFRRFFGEAETENLRALILWRARNPPPAPKPVEPTHAQ